MNVSVEDPDTGEVDVEVIGDATKGASTLKIKAPGPKSSVVNVNMPEKALEGISETLKDALEGLGGYLADGQKAVIDKLEEIASKPAPEPPIVITPTVQDVRIIQSTLPPNTRRVKRDPFGRVTEVTED